MNKKIFTLLTQDEIDALVEFLVDKKEGLTNDVLSQDSVDKLIHLIRGTMKNKFRLDKPYPEVLEGEKLLVSWGFCKVGQVCQLIASTNEKTGFLELTAWNEEEGTKVAITPNGFMNHSLEGSKSSWGFCLPPISFDEIAEVFGLKYTKETYDFICELFSVINYGKKNIEPSVVYLPDADKLLDSILA